MKELAGDCFWHEAQLAEALQGVAGALGLRGDSLPGDSAAGPIAWEERLESLSSPMGLDVTPISIAYGDADLLLNELAPAFLEPMGDGRFLVLLRKRWSRLVLLKPDRSTVRISLPALKSYLCAEEREAMRAEVEGLLDLAAIGGDARARTLDALLAERLKSKGIARSWRLRASPGTDFWQQVRRAGAIPLLSGFFISHAATYAVLLLFWGLLSKVVFSGSFQPQHRWLLVGSILSLVPLRLISPWLYGILSIRVGERLKQRLLYGAMRLEPDEIRHQGVGGFLGRVIETESIETSAMRGSGTIFMGSIQLLVTLPYLVSGAGGWVPAAALCLWLAISFLMTRSYFAARLAWTQTRLQLTNDTVEQLLGYRTRLVQQPRREWHHQEERLLADYDRHAEVMDRRSAWLRALLPRGWVLLGLLSLLPFLLAPTVDPAEVAIAISGILFASISFQQIAEGITQFSDAWVAWDQVRLLFDAAGRPLRSRENGVSGGAVAKESQPLLAGEGLRFRYDMRSDAILDDCNFSIDSGDRILLVGPSGSGKSTLTAVLSGLRAPQAGRLTFNGIADNELGERAWRKRIVAAPQFHENHIFTETFAFNLLMGRRWPPTRADLEKAQEICRALGLDRLLEEMPGGMFQFVGETGWQLSHGERSRVYIARALLQGADVVVLDESFSALDPENLRQSLECVVEHAPTLVVVAHP